MDPTKPLPPNDPNSGRGDTAEAPASLEKVLADQLELAKTIQTQLRDNAESMAPRDYKDLIAAASSIVGLAHRTDEAQRTIRSLNTFIDVTMEFLRSRSDQLGVDLVAELKEVAASLKAEHAAELAISRKPPPERTSPAAY